MRPLYCSDCDSLLVDNFTYCPRCCFHPSMQDTYARPDPPAASPAPEPPSPKDSPAGFLVGVCVVVLDALGRVLISQRLSGDGAGQWACPGGMLEPGDRGVISGAHRELLEETGLTLSASARLTGFVTEGTRASDNRPYVTLYALGRATNPEKLQNLEPHKHGGWVWVAFEKFPDRMWHRQTVQSIALLAANHGSLRPL